MENQRKSFVDKNPILKIIIFNLVIYAIILFWEVMNGLPMTKNGLEPALASDQIYHPVTWFGLPGNFQLFIRKPWSILTFMFVHERFFSILSNMIWLYVFGNIFQIMLSGKKILPLYLYGGFVGGIVYLLVSALANSNYYLLNASLPVFAIAVAVTTLAPNYKIFTAFNGGFSLWILTVVYAALTLFTGGSIAGIFAHLAAAAMGFVFIKQLQKGNDLSAWMINLANKTNHIFEPSAQQKPFENKASKEMELNKILDKINTKGIQSLSKNERNFLNNQSK